MDLSFINDIGHFIVKLKMHPYFDIANFTLMAMAIREDIPFPESIPFSRRHPFASWFSTMIMCFAGSIFANFLIGESLLTPFKNHEDILLASVIWYLMNYSPFDFVYKIARSFPIKLIIYTMKEIQRARNISLGISVAHKLYPDAYLVCIIIGIVKGAGALEVQIVERLIRGIWLPASNEFLKPSFISKASALLSILFLMEKLGRIVAPPDQIFLGAVIFLVYFRLSSLILGMIDPFAPFENLFCAIFMGGLVDALKRAMETSKTKRETNSETSKHANSTNDNATGAPPSTEEKKNK